MAHVQYLRHYESVSRDPATLGEPIVALVYTIDGQGPFEVRVPRKGSWETGAEAAIRADAQQRGKLLKVAFDV